VDVKSGLARPSTGDDDDFIAESIVRPAAGPWLPCPATTPINERSYSTVVSGQARFIRLYTQRKQMTENASRRATVTDECSASSQFMRNCFAPANRAALWGRPQRTCRQPRTWNFFLSS
jgi:hypothetical protein